MKAKLLLCLLILVFGIHISPKTIFAAENDSAYERVIKSGTLRCGYFIWPPYMDKDVATGQFSGIYYDIIEGLGKTLGLKIEWSYEYAIGQQVEALRSGKMDALCADGPWTRSAMPYVDYSHSYMFIPGYIYVTKEKAQKYTLETLNSPDVVFTGMDGDGSSDYLDMLFPKVKILSIPSTSDPSLLVENVLTGKADAMWNDPISVEAQSKSRGGHLVALNPEKPLSTYPWVISVPKGEQSLLNTLNQGIDLLNDSGFLDKTLKKYDPTGRKLMPPKERYRTK